MKTRLLGAAVLIALAVLFVPMFFSSSPPSGDDQTVSLAIPPAPDRDLQTRTMDLSPDVPPGSSSAPLIPSQAPVPSDKLATVDIGSRRPRDVETDPEAGKAPEPTTVTPASAPATVAPVQQAAEPQARAPTVAPTTTPAAAPTATAGTAARGDYTLNLSAYANTASAQGLIRKVQALGYPVSGRAIRQGGKTLTLVTAGPFATRTAAEAARLRITQTIPGAPARLESGASDQHGDVAAKPAATATRTTAAKGTATARSGGYAVQVAAMASQADAQALRDKLRAAGFDGFVDSVNAGGKRLWRVRAGPQVQRDDALRVRDQIKAKLGLGGNVVSVP